MKRRILDISKENIIQEGIDAKIIEDLLNAQLNISRLGFENIPQLFNKLNSRDPGYQKEWLMQVWAYYEICASRSPQKRGSYLSSLNNLPAYCGKVVGGSDTIKSLSPSEFSSGQVPAILDPGPSGREVDKLIGSLKGLILLDRSTFPEEGQPRESVWKSSGAHRLLKAIEGLARETPSKSSSQYIIDTVAAEDIKVSTFLRESLKPKPFH
jgi:hypothetical protein